MGREQILEAAVALLEHAELADLLSFLGTRAVAEAADVQPATVHHHFANRDDNPRSNARLAAAVLDACLAPGATEGTAAEVQWVTETPQMDSGELAVLRGAAQANLEDFIGWRRMTVGTLLAAAVAANDPIARDGLGREYEAILDRYVPVFDALARRLDRRFDTEHGFTAETMSVFLTALVDGLALRHQFDPDRVHAELFGELTLRIFEAITTPHDHHADEDVTDRLVRRHSALELPPDSPLDPVKRARIADAAMTAHERGGVEALTVSAVARDAGVSRSTVVAHFGGRSGLAAAVWAQHLPELARRLDADRERRMPLTRILERHLHRLVDLCRAAPELTAVLLEGLIGQAVRTGAVETGGPGDPTSPAPIASLLVPLIEDAAPYLRRSLFETRAAMVDLAGTVTYVTMVRAMTRRDESSSTTVHYVMDLVGEGVVDRDAATGEDAG